jgi:hypothetical protein
MIFFFFLKRMERYELARIRVADFLLVLYSIYRLFSYNDNYEPQSCNNYK